MVYWGLIGRCERKPSDVQLVTLKSVNIKLSVRGFTARVEASLTYHNATEDPLEIEYQIPVDEGAAVYKFEAAFDGKRITAQCMEKTKAEKIYKEAVQSGHTAFLGREDELLSDVFHMALGNLPAGTEAELKMSMMFELRVKSDGGVNFTLPTVLNPRYCPADITPDQHTKSIAQHVGSESLIVSEAYTFGIEAHVQGGHAITRIISHSDPLNVKIHDDNMSAEITQDGGGFKPDHDWSMLLYYTNPYKTHLIRETGDRSSTGLMKDDLVMVNLYPELTEESYSNKNEIIFVVDRSGSMNGEKIQSARATLLLFLKSLPEGCYFNVISFGSSHTLLFSEGSKEYNETTLQRACELHSGIDADMGGTEILQPLKTIYAKPPKEGYARQVILLTDGQVFNVDQVKALVSRHAHETRVFAVGIGHGASTALVHGLAKAGCGRAEMVYQQDKLQMKVMSLVRAMLQESVQNVKVNFAVDPPGGIKLVPRVPPVIFGGQHLILYAQIPSSVQVKGMTVSGDIGGNVFVSCVQGTDIVKVHDEDMTLHRLAARAQINEWQMDNEDDVVEDMINLSLASGVLCRKTALIGVDQDMTPVFKGSSSVKTQVSYPSNSVFHSGVRQRCSYRGGITGSSFCFGASSPCLESLHSRKGIPRAMKKSVKRPPLPPPPASCLQILHSKEVKDILYCAIETIEVTDIEQENSLMKVVTLQKFNGSWTLVDAARLTSIPRERLSKSCMVKNENSWATAVLLCFLELKHSEDQDQWALLANKAKMFISSCGDDVEALIAAAKKFLSEAKNALD